jgi:hypothetical protein
VTRMNADQLIAAKAAVWSHLEKAKDESGMNLRKMLIDMGFELSVAAFYHMMYELRVKERPGQINLYRRPIVLMGHDRHEPRFSLCQPELGESGDAI